MAKKTLIVNGSPRPEGETAYLIGVLKQQLRGEVVELSAFRDDISPCVDCRKCLETGRCAVDDDMRTVYDDEYDNVVLATPIYFADLPGQVLSLMSRFQAIRAAKLLSRKAGSGGQPEQADHDIPPCQVPYAVLRKKKAAVILTAGGKGNESNAAHHIHVFFRMLNGYGYMEHYAAASHTDDLPASCDEQAIGQVRDIAAWLNAD